MKVHRYVICNVKQEHWKDVEEALITLVQKGIIKTTDVHTMEEEERK
jgi:hypothetical protein